MNRLVVSSIIIAVVVAATAQAADYTLYAGQTIDVGIVRVTDDGTDLHVEFILDSPWVLMDSHVHVATSLAGIPQTKKGNPIPGQFDWNESDGDYTIPLPGGSPLYIAAHALVAKMGLEPCGVINALAGSVTGFDSTTGFSTDNTTNNLATDTLSLLAGFGQLVGSPRNLSHRGTRGLGVQGGEENDEVDRDAEVEGISLTFDDPVWVTYVELRSLFNTGGTEDDDPEIATVSFRVGGGSWTDEPFTGTEAIGDGGNGVVSNDLSGSPIEADEIAIGIPSDNTGECAFARLEFSCATYEQEETAWGDGPDFPGKNWATYFTYTPD